MPTCSGFPLENEYARLANRVDSLRDRHDRLLNKIDDLMTWKAQALAVAPPMQEIGKELGVRPGDSIHDKILPGIRELKEQNFRQAARNAELQAEAQELRERLEALVLRLDNLARTRDCGGYSKAAEMILEAIA